jgi:hypothetical protein
MKAKYKELAMMFTGGVDTTLAAARILESGQAERLHLLTFCNGMCIAVNNSGVHVEELRRKYGKDRIIHEISYVTETFEELRSPVTELIKEWGSTLIVDLCCRLSFETTAIIYCINNGITDICDGTNIDQGKLFLEKPEYLRVAKEYFASYGINYFSPVYARSGGRKGRMKELSDRGITVGPKIFEKLNITSSLFHQPFCLFGIHTFFFTSFMREAPFLKHVIEKYNLPVERAIEARLNRQEIGHRIIATKTAGWSAEEIAEGLKVLDRACTTKLCGLNGIEVALPPGTRIDIDTLTALWKDQGEVTREGNYARLKLGKLDIQAFANGRAVINGTKDRDRAVELYRDHVACHDVFSVG